MDDREARQGLTDDETLRRVRLAQKSERTVAEINSSKRKIHNCGILLFHKVVFHETLEVKYKVWRQSLTFVSPQITKKFLCSY